MVDQEELLMREVDEDVRRDKFDEAWKKYRVLILGTAVSIVLVVAANSIWKSHVKTTRDAASDIYTATLTKSAIDGADISALWSESRADLNEGYIELSYLQEAAALFKAGKYDEALVVYNSMAAQSNSNERMRELALLLASRIEYQQGKYAQARGRLITLSGADNIWSYSANETLALIDIAEGNLKQAIEKLNYIAESTSAPAALQKRAGELRQFLAPQVSEDITETITEPDEEIPAPTSSSLDQQESNK